MIRVVTAVRLAITSLISLYLKSIIIKNYYQLRNSILFIRLQRSYCDHSDQLPAGDAGHFDFYSALLLRLLSHLFGGYFGPGRYLLHHITCCYYIIVVVIIVIIMIRRCDSDVYLLLLSPFTILSSIILQWTPFHCLLLSIETHIFYFCC